MLATLNGRARLLLCPVPLPGGARGEDGDCWSLYTFGGALISSQAGREHLGVGWGSCGVPFVSQSSAA